MRVRLLIVATLLLAPAAALAVPCPDELPVLFVVQDKSNSMWATPSASCPTCPTKWESSQVAVTSLGNSFSNRFRFGLQMYPRDATSFNCTAGTVRSPVPSDAAALDAAFSTYYPGGGTPTASSLDEARHYLDGLNLGATEPAYILLLTDGLPNCSALLDPATCDLTTGCASNSSCLSRDCLDDGASAAAASALRSAGYPVYVVGFGTGVSADNDKVVLDAIAQAGGTGQALVATDQAALVAALEQVAFDASTCCKDVCTAGAAQCTADGQLKQCQMDSSIGCTNWFIDPCPAGSTCLNGSCQGCSNECTAGQVRCQGDSAQRCSAGADGCLRWVQTDDCGWGELCVNGGCQDCELCSSGQSRCAGTEVESCELDFWTGCTEWSRAPCADGSVCSGGGCQGCTSACTAGSKRCAGEVPESCVTDSEGCTSWQAGVPCTDFCSGGACGSCGTTCAIGEVRCNGAAVDRCVTDANGCSVWTESDRCVAGELCLLGRCESCPVQCAAGETRCVGSTVEECVAQSTGCNAWASRPCVAGDRCIEGRCMPPCTDDCTEGEGRCDLQGQPLVCLPAPTGCTVWMSDAPCELEDTCVEGVCREPCVGSEIETCRPGFVCTGVAEGRVCLPVEDDPKDPPVVEPPPVEPGDDDGHGTLDPDGPVATAGAGCGCGAAAGSAMWLLAAPFALGALRRRRR